MFPVFTTPSIYYCGPTHAKLFSKNIAGYAGISSNAQNIHRCKFGIYGLLSFARATLFNHILQIIFPRSLKQVFRIHTGRIIASVANCKSFNVFIRVMQLIRNAGGATCSSAFDAKQPVSLTVFECLPVPASFGFFHLAPKKFFEAFVKRYSFCSHSCFMPRLRLFVQRSGIFIMPTLKGVSI